jgi:cellulose synthase/poly-beta-1,6-N-acetylglucosamine synthase-like glycosyltransferase
MWQYWFALFFFFVPLFEAVIWGLGELKAQTKFNRDPSRFTQLIIQITTVGAEQERVNQIINEIHSYKLTMPYEIWVVNEPDMNDSYPCATRIITVNPAFRCKAQYKARALEYSRILRKEEELDRADVKILFIDDDTSPTKSYIETAFAGNYDLCQGVTTPQVEYGKGSFSHFLLSHMDDMRTLSCMIYCSFFQGVIRKPLFVHGEGLCITGAAESKVTWNYPVFASEDLVFGLNAAHQGLLWGFFHDYIRLTSPWSWGAFLKQRKRWLWGNIDAMTNREILPFWPAMRVTARYLFSFCTFIGSMTGIVLILSGLVDLSMFIYAIFWGAFAAWIGAFAISGWVNSKEMHSLPFRLWQAFMAVILCPVTIIATVSVLVTAFFQGKPKKFEVIAKTNKKEGQLAVRHPSSR